MPVIDFIFFFRITAPRQEPARTYEANKEIYGQSWDHHPELTQKGIL